MARGQSRQAAGMLSAFVLHHHDWSESSLILDLFTLERGRLTVVAKGAKRPYSQLRPVLLPFQLLQLNLGRAPADEGAEIFNLRHAEWHASAPLPSGPALLPSYYLNELLLRLLPRDDPHPRVFEAYALSLAALTARPDDSGAPQVQAVLRAFEWCLLREMGHLPELDRVTSTQQTLRPGSHYRCRPEGVETTSQAMAGSVPSERLMDLEAALRQCAQAEAGQLARAWPQLLLACEADHQPSVQAALRHMTRDMLDHHLGPQTLRSRGVMRGVQGLLARQVSPPSEPKP